MRLARPERVTPPLALGLLALVGPGAVLGFLGHDKVHVDGLVHFVGVGFTAAAASLAALALTVIGAQRRDGRTVLVGTAFSVMAALLALHGLATPGFLVGQNGLVAFTGAATLPVGGGVLALSALPSLRRPQGVRALLVLQAGLIVLVVALGLVGLLVPSTVPSVPEPAGPLALSVLTGGLLFFGVLFLRALKTAILTRRAGDFSVVVGTAWLAAALPGALVFSYLHLGWWVGHGLELAGIVLVGIPVAADLRRSAQSRPLAGDLQAAELVAQEEAFLGARVHALTQRLARKDAYTEEHTRRVALLGVQVGEELGLPPHRLRNLAIGGLLHDVGKLSIPDVILKKRGKLDAEEFDVIRTHPDRGARLLEELGGFPPPVHRLVRNHHERIDGAGYPRGLAGSELDLDTRVLTVCDVYDALRSTRVYREAWTHEAAIELLRRESGAAFDPATVAALERVLERAAERPVLHAAA